MSEVLGQIQIKVYDKSLNFIGIVEDYESSGFTRSWYEAGQWSITINKNINNSDLLQAEYYVQFGEDDRDSGKITCVTNNIDENGKGGQKLVVAGKDLKTIFSQRYVMDMNDVDAYTLTAPGETVIKTLISSQCGATCVDPKRVISNLVIATDQGRGLSYTLSCKYTQVYSECATAATQSLVGWFVYIDHANKTFVLDCEVGLDRSYGQQINPYCLFSPDMDSLKSATLKEDIASFRNLVYVGGDGTGADRQIHTGFDTVEPEGIDRYELFDNASSLSTTAAMSAEAQNILTQYNQSYELSGAILIKSPYVYKENYNVGDLCTVRFNDKELDIRILSITQNWASGSYDISSVWGKPIRGLSDQVSAINTSTTSNNGTSEAGTNVSGMKSGVKSYDLSSSDVTMNGSECIYNIIELTGTLTANRTFNFYLDTTRLYGKKIYSLKISATGGKIITLTTGIVGKISETTIAESAPYIIHVMVDDTGNVTRDITNETQPELPSMRFNVFNYSGLLEYLRRIHRKNKNIEVGSVVAYTHGATAVVNAYIGGVYSPTQNRIYFVPLAQSNQSVWHYLDCATGSVVAYTHGATAVVNAYVGGVYSPTQNRIYFVPYAQANQSVWHYILELSSAEISPSLMASTLFNKL